MTPMSSAGNVTDSRPGVFCSWSDTRADTGPEENAMSDRTTHVLSPTDQRPAAAKRIDGVLIGGSLAVSGLGLR
jgi:hypothetical protein